MRTLITDAVKRYQTATDPAGGPPATPPAAAPTAPPAAAPPAATPPSTEPPAIPNQEAAWRRKAEDAERELKKLKDADEARKTAELTEIEREKQRADKAEKTAGEHAAELAKLRVANAKGIPAEALSLLTGTDEATLTAQADAILALRGPGTPPPTTPPAPVRGGQHTNPGTTPPASITEQIDAAYNRGDTTEAIRLKRNQAFGGTT